MHHYTIEEKLDGSQLPLQPFNRSPLQAVNRQPLQSVSQNFSLQFQQSVNQRQLVATHPVGPRKPRICSVGHRSLLTIQQAPHASSILSRPTCLQHPQQAPYASSILSRPHMPPASSAGPICLQHPQQASHASSILSRPHMPEDAGGMWGLLRILEASWAC